MLIFLSIACYNADRFQADFADVSCRKYDECGYMDDLGYADVDACITQAESQSDDDSDECDFDKKNAKECLDGWEALACDDIQDVSKWPTACADVAECPDP